MLIYKFLLFLFVISSKFNPILPIEFNGISSTFGEYRGDRFHTGIDFKTRKKIGYKIKAVETGYLFRIKSEFRGYGLALYLKHNNDWISVYAHLSKLCEKFQKLLESFKRKYSRKYGIDLFFKKKKYKVKKGELIALSGESGVGGPHLHFEVRKNIFTPVNSLKFFKIKDTIPPVIEEILFEDFDFNSLVEKDNLKISKLKSNQKFKIKFAGRIGIKIRAYDFINGSHNRLGLSKLELYLNKSLIYAADFSQVSFKNNHTGGVIYSLSDTKSSRYVYKLYYIYDFPFNEFIVKKGGIINSALMQENDSNYVSIKAYDFLGNCTCISFTLIPTNFKRLLKIKSRVPVRSSHPNFIKLSSGTDFLKLKIPFEKNIRVFGFNEKFKSVKKYCYYFNGYKVCKLNLDKIGKGKIIIKLQDSVKIVKFRKIKGKNLTSNDGRVSISLNNGLAFYTKLYVQNFLNLRDLPSGLYQRSKVYYFMPAFYPAERLTLKMKVPAEYLSIGNKLGIFKVALSGKLKYSIARGKSNRPYLSASLYHLEPVVLIEDRKKPYVKIIKPVYQIKKAKRILIKTYDIGLGINYKKIKVLIDNNPIECEYDPDKSSIIGMIPDKYKKGQYILKVIIPDYADNYTVKTRKFSIK